MSDAINDDGAVDLSTGLMPVSALDDYRQVAKTAQLKKDGKTFMGSELLYPFYGGKKAVADVSTFYYHVKWDLNAAQIGTGQAVVAIINNTDHAFNVTRPYRDGGWMIGVPHDPAGTANRIPGKATMGGKDYFGIGCYINGIASIFYGAGAVLKIQSEDSAVPAMLFAYGSSINSGQGMGVEADASTVSDTKAWFGKTGDKTDMTGGTELHESNSKVTMQASVSPWDRLDGSTGPLFTVLIE